MDCGSFFDQIEDLLDFPSDDIDTGLSGNLDAFPSIWSSHLESLPDADSVFSDNASPDLYVPVSFNCRLRFETFRVTPVFMS
jgi:hypothetical protein